MTLKFGTSGVRGLVTEMTDIECYLFSAAFVKYAVSTSDCKMTEISVAGDLRTSSPRIMKAAEEAVQDAGLKIDYCGFIPTPALIYRCMKKNNAGIMVTGSHIPDDRNGIKFNLASGEILKTDEKQIFEIYNFLKNDFASTPFFKKFDDSGFLINNKSLKQISISGAAEDYNERYLEVFDKNCLHGYKIAVYQHSSVSRDIIPELLTGLGAEVIKTGFSDKFVPVDTESVESPEKLYEWVKQYNADCLVSADGDGDRPLIVSDDGTIIRGDVIGIFCAEFLKIESLSIPVSCNTAVEKYGKFKRVNRTKIGSPFVIEDMILSNQKYSSVAGYEANGGFLLGSDAALNGKILKALPTRDAVLPIISVLIYAKEKKIRISELADLLPERYTYSGLLRNFPVEKSVEIIDYFKERPEVAANIYFESVNEKLSSVDYTDGCRITFESGRIIHLRPSGNAPEFRCYTETESEQLSKILNEKVLSVIKNKK